MGMNNRSMVLVVSLVVAIVGAVIYNATDKSDLESLLFGGAVFGGTILVMCALAAL
ncbi:hypothetical protein [Streptomyces tailanensis]|uniref:hypothetical protein n=1 Tax=Streptomyces tailanensis TaxID=2569858 RepID=UPI00155A7D5C|nr:hypothetical protein [Streptomyces tailanensis]